MWCTLEVVICTLAQIRNVGPVSPHCLRSRYNRICIIGGCSSGMLLMVLLNYLYIPPSSNVHRQQSSFPPL